MLEGNYHLRNGPNQTWRHGFRRCRCTGQLVGRLGLPLSCRSGVCSAAMPRASRRTASTVPRCWRWGTQHGRATRTQHTQRAHARSARMHPRIHTAILGLALSRARRHVYRASASTAPCDPYDSGSATARSVGDSIGDANGEATPAAAGSGLGHGSRCGAHVCCSEARAKCRVPRTC